MEPADLCLAEEPGFFRSRKGCWIETVVVLGIVGIGAMLLIPAVNSARMAARRAQFM